jgi:serine/threonine protein kinase/tetratricopeptide (TPR) repeat protein
MTTAPQEPTDLQDLIAGALAAYDESGEPGLATYLVSLGPRAEQVRPVLARFLATGVLQRTTAEFPERLGDFKLVRRLGAGGMGLVFLAEQLSLKREVALKLVRPELLVFEGARERFRREVDAVASLRHPGIVPILAVGEDHGIPFFAMELIDGRSGEDVVAAVAGRDPATLTGQDLWQLLAAAAPHATTSAPPMFQGTWWQACARLCAQLAQTMRHVHLRGIVHRDLKPSNVMLTPHGQALVLDFGLAHVAAHDRITRTGSELGSPAYMSPEQIRGEPLDERTDVYSLGATLYQLLCLRPPYAAPDSHTLRANILAGIPPRPRQHNRSLPTDLATVCLKALDPERQRRYATMAEFAADLEAVAAGRSVRARPLSLAHRSVRWMRRHRAASVGFGALSVFLTLVPALLWWQQREATRKIASEYSRAQRNLAVSKEAVQTMLVRLGEVDLAATPGADQLRVRLLEDAVVLYQKLLADQSDDPALRAERARTHEQLGKMLVELGRNSDAERALRETIAATGGDTTDVDAEALAMRTRARQALAAAMLGRGEFADATAMLEAKRRELELLIAREPDTLRTRLGLATTLSTLATCERRQHPDDPQGAARAEARFAQVCAILADAIAWQPDYVQSYRLLAATLQELAFAQQEQGRHADAIATLDREIALVEPLTDDGTARPRKGELLMLAHSAKGVTWFDAGDFAAAAAAHQHAVDHAELLVRDFPANATYASRLGTMLGNLASALQRQGDHAAALPLLDRAVAQQQAALALGDFAQAREHQLMHYHGLVRSHTALGHRTALARAADALAEHARDAADRFDAACALAEAAAMPADDATAPPRDVLVRRALEHLSAAERQGWPKRANLDSPRLVALRGEPEFAALQQRVAR